MRPRWKSSKGGYHCGGTLDVLCKHIAEWRDGKGFETNWHNVPEKLMLVVTELGEAMEAYRCLSPVALAYLRDVGPARASQTWTDEDYHQEPGGINPTRAALENFQEELADAAIRLFDLAASLGISLEDEVSVKMDTNAERPPKHGKER